MNEPIDLRGLFTARFQRSVEVQRHTLDHLINAMAAAAERLIGCYSKGGKALFFGNGGSAADAQHLAAEFVGRFLRERAPWPALALNVNASAITALANDFGYEQVFARQIEALGNPGDVAIGLSTSGKSPNVIAGLRAARARGMATIAMTGLGGGPMRELSEILLDVPATETPRIQECHMLIGHTLCEAVEQALTRGES